MLLFGVMLALNLSREATVAISTMITLDICLPSYFALELLMDST